MVQADGRCRLRADVRQMEADARVGSDKSLHIYLYTNKAGGVGGCLSRSRINSLCGGGRARGDGVRGGSGGRLKKYLFKIYNGGRWRARTRAAGAA